MESLPNQSSTSDPVAVRTSGWGRQLFAVGCVAGLSGFEVTEAALVVTELDLSLTALPRRPAFSQLDLNGDGTNDVGLVVGTASQLDSMSHNGWVNAGGIYGAEAAFSNGFPQSLQPGDSVGSSLNFVTAVGTLALSSGGPLGQRGNWMGGADAYLGVRFLDAGETRYGWVHLVWEPGTNTLTVDQVAYQSSGGPALIPEPSALALLAMGAIGLGARRRRKA